MKKGLVQIKNDHDVVIQYQDHTPDSLDDGANEKHVFPDDIVGIPIGRQCFKNAQLALTPFGAKIVKI